MLYLGAKIVYIKSLNPKELTSTMKEKGITNMIVVPLVAKMLKNSIDKQIKKQPKSSLEFLNNMPYIGTIIESVVQGAANAIMTLRIGCVCRRYLFSDGNIITKEEIRKQAYKEAMKLIPLVVADTITFFPKKVVKFFSNFKKKNESEESVVVSE